MEDHLQQIFDQMDKHPIIPLGMFLFLIVAGYLNWRKKKADAAPVQYEAQATQAPARQQRPDRPARKGVRQCRDLLSDTLFRWSPRDPFLMRDLLRSVAIFGATGSGKTSGSGRLIASALARHPRVGGLILASKPECRYDWQKIFYDAGRPADLIIFNPEGPYRFNFI